MLELGQPVLRQVQHNQTRNAPERRRWDRFDQIPRQEDASQFGQMIDIFYGPQAVRLQPQTLELGILLQILDLPKALEV